MACSIPGAWTSRALLAWALGSLSCGPGGRDAHDEDAALLVYRSVPDRTLPLQMNVESWAEPADDLGTPDGSERYFEIEAQVDFDLVGRGVSGALLAHDLVVHRMAMTTLQGGQRTSVEMNAEGTTENGVHHAPSNEAGREALAQSFGQPVATVSMPIDGESVGVRFLGSAAMEEALGGFRLADNLLIFFPVLPVEPVRPGDRWVGRRPVPMRYRLAEPVVLDMRYELAGLSEGLATIRATGSYEGRDLVGTDSRGRQVRLERLSYRTEGRVVFGVERGELESVELALEIDLELAPERDGESGLRLRMPSGYRMACRSD